jgi:hypothetical protein
MRILLVHQCHPNALGNYFSDALRRLGHQVTWVGESDLWGQPGYLPNIDLSRLFGTDVSNWDIAIATDDHWLPSIPQGWERLPFPTILVSFDYQHDPRWFNPLLPLFDHIVLLNLDPVRRVAQSHPSVHWIPAAVDPRLFPCMNAERVYEVGVVGGINPSYPRRVKRLAEIVARYKTNDVDRYYSLHQIAEVYNRSKIVINLMPDGIKTLTYRTFEGMACGALMLTEETDSGLGRLFRRGEHLVVFRDDAEMYRLIDYYLAHETEREQIARAGQLLVRTQHTWDERMKTLVDTVAIVGMPLTAPARQMPEGEVQRLYACAYMRRLKIDPIFQLFGDAIPPLWVFPMVVRILVGRIGFRRRWRQWQFQRQRAHLRSTKSKRGQLT